MPELLGSVLTEVGSFCSHDCSHFAPMTALSKMSEKIFVVPHDEVLEPRVGMVFERPSFHSDPVMDSESL